MSKSDQCVEHKNPRQETSNFFGETNNLLCLRGNSQWKTPRRGLTTRRDQLRAASID